MAARGLAGLAVAGALAVSASGCGDEVALPLPTLPSAVVTAPAADATLVADRGYVAVVAAVEAVDVAPTFEGILTAVNVRAGDKVTAGQVLAELDPQPLREELAVSEAALRAAKARSRQARVDVHDAQREVKSVRRAVADGVESRRKLEEAQAALERAQAASAGAVASVGQADATVDRARTRVKDTSVRAPFAGTVALRMRERGASVGPGAPVVRLLGEGGLRIRFAVPPEDARRFAPGQPILADIEGAGGELRAQVRQVSPELDGPTRLIFIEADVESGPDGTALQPGLPARVRRPR